jgi:hypothetical protein
VNIVAPVTAANALPTFFSMPSASVLAGLTNTLGYLQTLPHNDLAQYGFPNNITGYHPWGNSRYNGLALQLNKRYSRNFMYIAAYTWSQNFDDSTAPPCARLPESTRGMGGLGAGSAPAVYLHSDL